MLKLKDKGCLVKDRPAPQKFIIREVTLVRGWRWLPFSPSWSLQTIQSHSRQVADRGLNGRDPGCEAVLAAKQNKLLQVQPLFRDFLAEFHEVQVHYLAFLGRRNFDHYQLEGEQQRSSYRPTRLRASFFSNRGKRYRGKATNTRIRFGQELHRN